MAFTNRELLDILQVLNQPITSIQNAKFATDQVIEFDAEYSTSNESTIKQLVTEWLELQQNKATEQSSGSSALQSYSVAGEASLTFSSNASSTSGFFQRQSEIKNELERILGSFGLLASQGRVYGSV